jgi:hypothetical protein
MSALPPKATLNAFIRIVRCVDLTRI